jgi:allantoicase
VFDAFVPSQPEPITDRGPLDPLAPYNKAVGGRILDVSNERFARAENLISDHLPKFDPELFGKQGKVMDSWETVRHNPDGVDTLTFALKEPAPIDYVLLSTKYHYGNHSPFVRLEGLANGKWEEFLPKTAIEGHSEMRIKLPKTTGTLTQVRVSMYPDGGFSRLGLFTDLPADEKATFLTDPKSLPFSEEIPHTKRPLTLKYAPTAEEIKKNLATLKAGEEFNNASVAYGARLVKATNEHYGPAIQVLSPFAPINMFDGLESARSRLPGHHEEVTVALAVPAKIHGIEMDFTYFVNNNPLEVSVEGLVRGKWLPLVERTNVKAFAANVKAFEINRAETFEQVRIQTFPCGGMNRLRVLSFR